MLKAVAGEPGNNLLVLGLGHKNLDFLAASPNDNFIQAMMTETGLPMDVILYAGDGNRRLGTHTHTNAPVFIIGITMEQIANLRSSLGKFVLKLDKDTYGTGVNIVIFSGETEASMTAELQDFIGPDTNITIDPRLKA